MPGPVGDVALVPRLSSRNGITHSCGAAQREDRPIFCLLSHRGSGDRSIHSCLYTYYLAGLVVDIPLSTSQFTTMSLEGALVKFVAKEDQKIYFASFELYSANLLPEKNLAPKPPVEGTVLQGYNSLEDLLAKRSSEPVTVQRVRVICLPRYAIADTS